MARPRGHQHRRLQGALVCHLGHEVLPGTPAGRLRRCPSIARRGRAMVAGAGRGGPVRRAADRGAGRRARASVRVRSRRTGRRAGGAQARLGACTGRIGPCAPAPIRCFHLAGRPRARAALAAIAGAAWGGLAGGRLVSEGIGPGPDGGYPLPEPPTYPGPTRERWVWTGVVVGLGVLIFGLLVFGFSGATRAPEPL